MNITVIGTGYVGLVAACCLANSGHQIVAVENNMDKLGQLQKGVIPIYEEGLDGIFQKVTGDGRLSFTDNIKEALVNSTMVIIAVGTPSLGDGRVDLSQVNDVAKSIVTYVERPLTVVMKSTVPPGTGRLLCDRYFDKVGMNISYVFNPEFLREGKALYDWYNTDRIVIGGDQPGIAQQVMDIYSDIEAPKVCMDLTSAEMVKYASNAFLATKISFINEIANLCEKVGADIDIVATTVGMDQRIGQSFLQAGLGYGGSCFPKDTKALDYIALVNGYKFSLLKAVIEVNAGQRIIAVRKLMESLGCLTNKKIAVLGLAFKPNTDDIREAPAIDIIDHLISEGVQVRASDPLAIDNARKRFPNQVVEFIYDPYEACEGCEAVVLATEWEDYVKLNWADIKKRMVSPYVVLDGRNSLDRQLMQELGFIYRGIGRSYQYNK